MRYRPPPSLPRETLRMLRGGSRCLPPALVVARIPSCRPVTLVHFRLFFRLGWRWCGPSDDWKTDGDHGSKLDSPGGTEAGPFAPLFSTWSGALPTNRSVLRFLAREGISQNLPWDLDLPSDFRNLGNCHRCWRPVPCREKHRTHTSCIQASS